MSIILLRAFRGWNVAIGTVWGWPRMEIGCGLRSMSTMPGAKYVTGWRRWLPGLQIPRDYKPAWLLGELKAGLVLTTLLLPIGIAYAEASGIPAVHGLYATSIPLLAYGLFGPSRILVFGPNASLTAIILGVVLSLSQGDPQRAVSVASALAIVSGLVCILMGLLRLGFVTELLSKPIRYGYLNGIALSVLISQTPKLFGFTIEGEGPLRSIVHIVRAILDGQTNWVTFAIGAGALLLILFLKRYLRVPGLFLALASATIVVAVFDLSTTAGVKVLGSVPRGLPSFAVPWINLNDLEPLLIGGVALAFVAFADTSVLSRSYAAKGNTSVDPNQELIGLGAANLAAGFFRGFSVSSSASRTAVAEASGAKTQLTCVFAAIVIALLPVVAPNLMAELPASASAAAVIASAVSIFEFADLRRIYRVQRWEFWLSIVCFAGVAVFGAIPGIGLAIVIAVIEFLWNAWRPYSTILGRIEEMRGFGDVRRFPTARQIPGLLLFRWDGPLFFANAELFQERLLEAVASSPTRIRRVIVTAEPASSIDVTAADMLIELDQKLRTSGIELRFAELKGPMQDKLRRFELLDRFGPVLPTLDAAADAYVREYQVDWKQ